jgi:tetratricopeptide (TPR) repeat protein
MLIPRPPLPRYLATLDAQLRRSGPDAAVRTLGQHVQTFPDHPAITADQRELLVRVLEAVQRIVREHGGSEASLVVEMMTLGKLGRLDEAVRRARRAFDESPTWATAVAAGNALRRAGDMRAAAEMFAAAAELDKEDVTALLEVGDIELEAGRLGEALSAYEAALGRESGHAWAEPSAWYCHYLLTRQAAWLKKLRKAASKPADECGVEGALAELLGGYSDGQRQSRAEYLLQKLTGQS